MAKYLGPVVFKSSIKFYISLLLFLNQTENSVYLYI